VDTLNNLSNMAAPNEPAADNVGGFRRLAFTKPANGSG
jgi:hypothetical protein